MNTTSRAACLNRISMWDFVEWPELKQKEFLLLMVLQQAEWANRIHRFLEARFGQTSSRENPE